MLAARGRSTRVGAELARSVCLSSTAVDRASAAGTVVDSDAHR